MVDKDKSIEFILSQGFTRPPSFYVKVAKMHGILGWRFIFWDFSYSFIFLLVTLAGVVFLLRHAPVYEFPYSVAAGFSPILFLLITLFTEINERTCNLYQLKQTCRYTSRQVTALRSMYYSVVGVGFAVLVAAISTDGAAQFFRVLPLCLGGLFLCAAVELLVIRLSRSKFAIAATSAAWLAVNLSMPMTLGVRWEALLSGTPLLLAVAFPVAAAAAFIYQTNKMLMEENSHAIA
ncbi:MAG: hypothetical protein FWC78_05845 [Defluviitaleaceae bacterium]|nr:hypothetical protein [Defluviitaleaceae bacterium]